MDPTSPHPHSAPLPRPPARPGQRGWWGPSDAPPARPPPPAAAHPSQCRCRALSKRAAPTAQQKRWEAPRPRPECGSLSPVASLAWQAPGSCSERLLPADEPPVRLEAVGWLRGDACVSGPRSVLGLHAHPARVVTWGPGAVPLTTPLSCSSGSRSPGGLSPSSPAGPHVCAVGRLSLGPRASLLSRLLPAAHALSWCSGGSLGLVLTSQPLPFTWTQSLSASPQPPLFLRWASPQFPYKSLPLPSRPLTVSSFLLRCS